VLESLAQQHFAGVALIRYERGGMIRAGVLHAAHIQEFDTSSVLDVFEAQTSSHPVLPSREIELQGVRLLPPVTPTKVVGLGLNYRGLVPKLSQDHEPVLFLKPPSSIVGPGDPIRLPAGARSWSEVEIGLVISKRARSVSPAEAEGFILGRTIGNDVTTANVSGRDHHLAKSKGLDSFCPLGPAVVLGTLGAETRLRNFVSGRESQNASLADRIYDDAQIVSWVSGVMTLEPGDVILTGTPAGAEGSLIRSGDRCELFVDGLGCLSNPVVGR
jgi:2-keto-4-pentenoate hydratase/2-oxohepta-3-ene-1,7-dioic acid hydratase in catechol pathway